MVVPPFSETKRATNCSLLLILQGNSFLRPSSQMLYYYLSTLTLTIDITVDQCGELVYKNFTKDKHIVT